jgi:hypothetical protein
MVDPRARLPRAPFRNGSVEAALSRRLKHLEAEETMTSGLDRHRNKDGEISRKHGLRCVCLNLRRNEAALRRR